MDIENESKILNNIFNYCKNKILILVSHRRETLKRCDYIFELDNGNLKRLKKMIKKILYKILWSIGKHTRIHLINRNLSELNYRQILSNQKYQDKKI